MKGCDGVKRLLLITMLVCLLLSVHLLRAKAVSGFVSSADVTWKTGSIQHHRHYKSPEKIQKLLHYIRTLRPKGKADIDPEILGGNACKIILYYQNGQRQIYYQRSDRYLSVDAHPWERIKPEQAEKLYPLLEEMPSDLPRFR